jgi:hypothetical protein
VTNSDADRRRIVLVAVICGLLIVIVGGYFAWKSMHKQPIAPAKTEEPAKLPRMANLPPKKPEPEPVAPSYPPDAPLLEQAREALRKGIDAAGAVALAKSLPDKPERADAAFLLLEYAADAGHAEASFEVARYFDPTDTGDSGSIIKDPGAAYDWYRVAQDGGIAQAQNHLSELRRWVEEKAVQGFPDMQELLKRWR